LGRFRSGKRFLNSFKTDFSTNYCGPYWSDGKFQSSTSRGSRIPVNKLDLTCQIHDASYALANGDSQLLNQADDLFFESNFGDSLKSSSYAIIVKYGNRLIRTNLLLPFTSALVGGIINASNLPKSSQRFRGTPEELEAEARKETKEVQKASNSAFQYVLNFPKSLPKTSEPSLEKSNSNQAAQVLEPQVTYAPKTGNSISSENTGSVGSFNPYLTGRRRNKKRRRLRSYLLV